MSVREQAIELRERGLTHTQIAEITGVSRQRICQITGKYDANYFKAYTESQVVYPNLRKWLNDNRVSRAEFIRRMGNLDHSTASARLSSYFRGKRFPQKATIDRMLEVTGLTYEELFHREVDR